MKFVFRSFFFILDYLFLRVLKLEMSDRIPGYKRHPLDEFSPDIKPNKRPNTVLGGVRHSHNSDPKKTRGRVKINIEV